jgi:hypothetical protein
MGNCGCGRNGSQSEERVGEVLGEAGLREIVTQARDVTKVMSESVRSLHKADRAAVLGLGDDVVRLHRETGERWNRQARRQFQAVMDRIDARRGQDDWPGWVDRGRREFDERDGPQQVRDLVAETRNTLLDMEVSAVVAEEMMGIVNRGAAALTGGGLDGIVSELRDVMERGLAAAEHPEMGRQPASPISEARAACVAVAWVAFAVAMGICSVITFCWCCAWPFIVAGLAIALTACEFID